MFSEAGTKIHFEEIGYGHVEVTYVKGDWHQCLAFIYKINYIFNLLQYIKADILSRLQQTVCAILITISFISAADEPREK